MKICSVALKKASDEFSPGAFRLPQNLRYYIASFGMFKPDSKTLPETHWQARLGRSSLPCRYLVWDAVAILSQF
jgi:hypothetical protein